MAYLTAVVEGAPELEAKVRDLKLALDTVHILDESGALLLGRIRQRFLAQTDADGTAWVPSQASILRATEGRGGGTLYDTGRLFNSIQLYATGPDGRAIGTDVEYAAKHNFGLEGFPKREFLGFSKADANLVQQLVIKRITEALGE